MDKFSKASSIVNVGANMNDNNEFLQAYINRLMSVIEVIIDEFGDVVCDIMCSPMELITTQLSDLSELKVYIVTYEKETEDEQEREFIKYKIKTLKSYCVTAFNGEFDDLIKVTIKISNKSDFKDSSILMYSMFKKFNIETLDEDTYYKLYLLCDAGYRIYIPTNFDYARIRNVIVLCNTMDSYLDTINNGINVKDSLPMAYCVNAPKDFDGIVYLPTLYELHYDLPYTLIDVDSFNEDRILGL